MKNKKEASSWSKPSVHDLLEKRNGVLCNFHQCRFGLRAPYSLRPVKKATRFITNNAWIKKRFHRKFCRCGKVRHFVCAGSLAGRKLSSHCAIYPKGLCSEMACAVQETVSKGA